MNEGKLQESQFGIMLFITIIGTIFLSLPRYMAQTAENSGWISVIVGAVLGLFGVTVMIALAYRFPDKSLVELSGEVLGRWAGKAVGISYSIYAIGFTALLTREFMQTILIALIPDSRISFLLIIFGLVLCYGVYLGIQPIAKASQFFLPFIVFAILFGFFTALPLADFGKLKPLFQPGFLPILDGSLTAVSIYGDAIVFLMLFPKLSKKKGVAKFIYVPLLLAAVALTSVTMIGIAIFGHVGVIRQTFPILSAARTIKIGDFFAHIEALFVTLWFFSTYLRIVILFYTGILSYAQVADLEDYRPLILPITGIVLFGAALPSNVVTFFAVLQPVHRWSFVYEFGLPLFLLAFAVLMRRGRRGRKREAHGK